MRYLRLLALLLIPFFVMGIIASTAAATAKAQGKASSPGQATNRNFVTSMSGDEETPPVDTQARGVAIFHLSPDGLSMDYKLNASNIISVTAGHIHIGTVGVPGPVVVPLVSQSACTFRDRQVRCEGTFTAANFVGPLAGHPMSDLIAMMEEGRAYTNVHTTAHPGGEIRGQLGRGNSSAAANKVMQMAKMGSSTDAKQEQQSCGNH